MKKIAIFTERLKMGFGVDLVVHEQATLLTKKHQVTVFAIDRDLEFIQKASYSVAQLWIPLFFNPLKQDLVALKAFAKHRHLFEDYNVFVVHTPTFNSWIPMLKKIGKVIVCYYGNSPSDGYFGLRKYRKNIFDFMEHNFYFRYADKIVTISNFLKNQLPLKLQSMAVTNHLGGDHMIKESENITSHQLKKIREKFFINLKSELLITYVGRLDYKNNPYKNTQQLIKLKKSLKVKIKKNVKFFAIGFPENNIEKKLFKNGIYVIPKASSRDLAAVLKSSYLLITPSLWEGFNLPLIEAQSLGIPVIAYDLGAHREVVENDKSGYLVNSFNEFKSKIEYLISNPQERNRLGRSASVLSRNFTWKKNVGRLEKYL